MSEELKRCPVPWCKPSGHPYSHLILEKKAGFVGLCVDCGIKTPEYPTEAEAIATWNQRPDSELERLAREVASQYSGMGFDDAKLRGACAALAAYLEAKR